MKYVDTSRLRIGYEERNPDGAHTCVLLHGAADAVTPVAASVGKDAFFRHRYERVLLPGVGHFPQRETPAKGVERVAQFIAN